MSICGKIPVQQVCLSRTQLQKIDYNKTLFHDCWVSMSDIPNPSPALSILGMIVVGTGIGFVLFGFLRAGLIEELVLTIQASVKLIVAGAFILGGVAFAYYRQN